MLGETKSYTLGLGDASTLVDHMFSFQIYSANKPDADYFASLAVSAAPDKSFKIPYVSLQHPSRLYNYVHIESFRLKQYQSELDKEVLVLFSHTVFRAK